jgi:hypothetical protein
VVRLAVQFDAPAVLLAERHLHPVDALDAHLGRADERNQRFEGWVADDAHPPVGVVGGVHQVVRRRRVPNRRQVVVEAEAASQDWVGIDRRLPFEGAIALAYADGRGVARRARGGDGPGVATGDTLRCEVLAVLAPPEIGLPAFERRLQVQSTGEGADVDATGLHTGRQGERGFLLFGFAQSSWRMYVARSSMTDRS